jgi:hypothetical protein
VAPEQYREALNAAIREYEALGAQRREIDERLAQLAQTIGTLNRLCGFVSTVPWGLTDACRVVLKNAGRAMTPTEVRDRLEAIGVDLTKYTNSLAAVHTVLKRLNQSQEVLFVERRQASLRANGVPRFVRYFSRRARWLRIWRHTQPRSHDASGGRRHDCAGGTAAILC